MCFGSGLGLLRFQGVELGGDGPENGRDAGSRVRQLPATAPAKDLKPKKLRLIPQPCTLNPNRIPSHP